jgi:hypothetical protein
MTFSIGFDGLTISAPDSCTGTPITEGDVLAPFTPLFIPAFGPLPIPCILITGGPGGLGIATHPPCVGHPPGFPCGVEVDALSYGLDFAVRPIPDLSGTFVFSVDECAVGTGAPRPPAVWTEAPFGDSSADVYRDIGLPAGPLGLPLFAASGHTGQVDGNGLVSPSGWVYPGTGLFEPDFPGPIDGDDLDAVDFDSIPAGGGPLFPVYFSLDGIGINLCSGLPKTRSAALNGFSGADVLVTPFPGAAPFVYAPGPALGLDLLGIGQDDLDALALWENGLPGFQPSVGPYSWLGPGATDMLLFSVCAGSPVVGTPDSFFGLPIQPGDILMPPIPGGLSPFPAIFIASEWIGLASMRTTPVADNLDALDTRFCPEPGIGYCFGDGSGTPCPCGNFGLPGRGCENSFATGGGLLTGAGKASVGGDTVVLTASGLPPTTTALFFQGAAQTPFGAVFGDGLLCTAGPVIRLGAKAAVAGVATWPGAPPISVGGGLPPAGGTRFYQCWYRNNAALFCTPARFNLTNAYSIVWTP